MKLKQPFVITSRLLPGLHFRDVANQLSELSIEIIGSNGEGRDIYKYYLDTPGFEYTNADLKSGCGGGSIQEGMSSLLSFLSACVESRQNGNGENADLFPDQVAQWASDHDNEIQMLQCELEENRELIED